MVWTTGCQLDEVDLLLIEKHMNYPKKWTHSAQTQRLKSPTKNSDETMVWNLFFPRPHHWKSLPSFFQHVYIFFFWKSKVQQMAGWCRNTSWLYVAGDSGWRFIRYPSTSAEKKRGFSFQWETHGFRKYFIQNKYIPGTSNFHLLVVVSIGWFQFFT